MDPAVVVGMIGITLPVVVERRADLTALLRWRDFSLVLTRFICDLMFGTGQPLILWSMYVERARQARQDTLPNQCGCTQISRPL